MGRTGLATARTILGGAMLLAASIGPVPAIAQSSNSSEAKPSAPVAQSVTLEQSGAVTRLSFRFSDPVVAHGYALANPDRLIIDLPEVNFQADPAAGRPAAPLPHKNQIRRRGASSPAAKPPPLAGPVASYRFGLFAPGKSRVVIDLAEPARLTRVDCEPDASGTGSRLVIEIARTERESFRAEAAKGLQAAVAPPATPVVVAPATDVPVIVLDAGHGGIDIGAHAANGVLEKEIVFEFARALQARLESGKRFKVVLTRDSDVFVSLSERVRRARGAGAALFVSIHADTLADEPSVSGATVYTVSDKVSDAEAARVAESENQADAAGGLDGRDDQTDVSDILFDLTRRETRAYSHVFARTLVGYWKEIGRLNKNPQRAAGFKVLKAPDVPSVLLELGYLSSEKDLHGLTSPEWRDKATHSVARAIEAFFRSRGQKERAAGGEASELKGLPAAETGSVVELR